MKNNSNTDNSLLFANFKFRCHRLGDLMTNLPGLSDAETKKLNILVQRDKDSKIGKAKDLTENMKEDLKELIIKRDKPDSLPIGAKSYLDDVFDEIFWRRKRLLGNKYLDKGLMNEQDVLAIHSQIDNVTYFKNYTRFYNDYLEGTPDVVVDKIVKDAKANYDLESFRKAHLSTGYLWQLKGYLWLTKLKQAELMYGLVNNPLHQINNAITSTFYALGCPADDDDTFIKAKMQIERNMIFDHRLFTEEYPNYVYQNPVLDFDMPPILRVKKYDVFLEDSDIVNMKSRVLLSRLYLCEKEIAVRKLDGSLIIK
ncbi:MAG TPA: hypothetical protein VIV55_10170 [Flavobacterium sp.]